MYSCRDHGNWPSNLQYYRRVVTGCVGIHHYPKAVFDGGVTAHDGYQIPSINVFSPQFNRATSNEHITLSNVCIFSVDTYFPNRWLCHWSLRDLHWEVMLSVLGHSHQEVSALVRGWVGHGRCSNELTFPLLVALWKFILPYEEMTTFANVFVSHGCVATYPIIVIKIELQ